VSCVALLGAQSELSLFQHRGVLCAEGSQDNPHPPAVFHLAHTPSSQNGNPRKAPSDDLNPHLDPHLLYLILYSCGRGPGGPSPFRLLVGSDLVCFRQYHDNGIWRLRGQDTHGTHCRLIKKKSPILFFFQQSKFFKSSNTISSR
jgi:hypothetical protein